MIPRFVLVHMILKPTLPFLPKSRLPAKSDLGEHMPLLAAALTSHRKLAKIVAQEHDACVMASSPA
jgi:hypothetical protein